MQGTVLFSGKLFPVKLVIAATAPTAEKPGSFIDGLDCDAAANIIRHLSSKPRNLQWRRYALCYDFRSASRLGDRFCDASRAVFSKVDSKSYSDTGGCCLVNFCELRDVLLVVGDKLQELHIPICPLLRTKKSTPWIPVLATNGAMARNLKIDYLGSRELEEAILFAVRGRVESLSIWGYHTEFLAAHFIGLRELYLQSMPKEDTKQLWRALVGVAFH